MNLFSVYKDEREEEMGMEIGLPTDVKHVSHIGLDGCTSSIFSKGWAEQELIDLHSFPLAELEFVIKAQANTQDNEFASNRTPLLQQ